MTVTTCQPGLEALLADIWSKLEASPGGGSAGFPLLTLASLDNQGNPSQRTLILRGADRTQRKLHFFTDVRSAKVQEIRTHPAVSLHGWNETHSVQLRLQGQAVVAGGQEACKYLEKPLPRRALALYGGHPAPGQPLKSPHQFQPANTREDSEQAFAVIVVTLQELEWLRLNEEDPHERAWFRWEAGQTASLRAEWLAP